MKKIMEKEDYKLAIDKENLKYEELKNKNGGKKEMKANLAERKETLKEELETKKEKIAKIITPKFTEKEMQEKAVVLLNQLKDSVNHTGLDLKLKPTNAWYVGYKVGRKCVFCVKYSSAGTLRVEVVVSKEQFKESGLKGEYFGNRYAEYPMDGDGVAKFTAVVQTACDNFKAKIKIVKPKEKTEQKLAAKAPKALKIKKAYLLGTATEQKLAAGPKSMKQIRKTI